MRTHTMSSLNKCSKNLTKKLKIVHYDHSSPTHRTYVILGEVLFDALRDLVSNREMVTFFSFDKNCKKVLHKYVCTKEMPFQMHLYIATILQTISQGS